MAEMKLQDLKEKSPTDLLAFAEEHGVENASTMRKQELMFATLKQLAAKDIDITGVGVVEVLQDGFGFLRSPDANYLPGRTTSTSRRRRSDASRCAPATRSRARSAARRMANATSRC
jgi:transcription termination factor Rho